MSGGSDGGVPVRPIHVRTVAVAGLVVALTVAFGASLCWVIPAMWALVCLGALVVVAVPTVFVSLAIVPYDIGDSRSAWQRITDHPPTSERVDRLRELVAEQ